MNAFNIYSLKFLLADTLREKHDSYVIEQICSCFASVQELLEATEQELTAIKGIGKAKAQQILAVIKLAKALNATATGQPMIIRSPEDAAKLLSPELRFLQKEHFVVLFLNTKNHVIAKETISIGSLNSTIVHPREIFKSACKRSAAAIILAHNHPSSDPAPSPEDIQLTTRVVECGMIIGIDVLDHIIIGGDRFYSLKQEGHM